MNAKTVTPGELVALVSELISAGTRVVVPAPLEGGREGVAYRAVPGLGEIQAGGPLPLRSLKEFFLPPTEPLLRFRQKKNDVETESAVPDATPTLILGARPCDAAALPILDRVMDWDYHDEPWFARREAATVVSYACSVADGSCFCTAVGLAPDSTQGADLLFVPTKGGYFVSASTPKGEAFLKTHSKHFVDAQDTGDAESYRAASRRKVETNLSASPKALQAWLKNHFDEAYWNDIAMRCHGCGVCASVCPTCHCFDIVDEIESVFRGTRRRNWDTCQTSKFTIHASGHNPRADQNARIRQRVMHKFFIYPERFGEVLCTGCGRCARACPAGMDLPEILRQISAKAGAAEAKAGSAS